MSNPLLKEIFHNLKPIPQNDGPNPICSINYTQEFTEAMGYLRAILQIDERSQRALDLTTICLKLNPANYTTWHFRRRCLAELSKQRQHSSNSSTYDEAFVQEDLKLASELGGGNPKNYQIWYHRRALLESYLGTTTHEHEDQILKSTQELKYISSVFEIDPKNYHAWSHRQWILRFVKDSMLWEEELKYVDYLLDEDCRNNSAWNQRWFVAHKGISDVLNLEDAVVEVEYAMKYVGVDPYNESPWRYLIGVLSEQYNSATDDKKKEVIALLKTYQEKVDTLYTSIDENEDTSSYYQLIAANIDILEMIGDQDSLSKAATMIHDLATIHDTIRAKYWLDREKDVLKCVQELDDN